IDAGTGHHVAEGRRVIGRLLLFGVAGERERGALLHQSERLFALRRRDQVDGAKLVFFAPAAPVRELRHPMIEGFLGEGRARLSVSHEPANSPQTNDRESPHDPAPKPSWSTGGPTRPRSACASAPSFPS